MTLKEKLRDIQRTKNEIAFAIEEKGVEVTSEVFSDYPDFIRNISTADPREPFYLELLKNFYFQNASVVTFSKLLPSNLRYVKIDEDKFDILMIPNTTPYVRPLMLIDTNFNVDTFKLRLYGVQDNEAFVLNNENDGLMVSPDGWRGLTANTSYGASNQFYFDILSGRDNKIFKSNNDLVLANSCDRTISGRYVGNKILSEFFRNCGNNIIDPKLPSEFDANVFSTISNFYKFDNLFQTINFTGWAPSEYRYVVFHKHIDGNTFWLNIYIGKSPFMVNEHNNNLMTAGTDKYVRVTIQPYNGYGGDLLYVDLTLPYWWGNWLDMRSSEPSLFPITDGDTIWSTDDIQGLTEYIPLNFEDFFNEALE